MFVYGNVFNIFIKMKSSLPAMFRHQDNSPEKQTSYYGLDLNFRHSYRTRIVNSQHKKSTQKDRIPASSHLVFKQRYSEYPSRSLSMQGTYED